MSIQTIFKAGNSNVVAIPSGLAKEIGITAGSSVVVEKVANKEAILISKPESKEKKVMVSKPSKEFQKWLNETLKEDKELLDELAIR